MEGKDFEPTIEALFGKSGFFPDTVSKAMYWAGDKMPDQVNEVLKNFAAPLKNEKTKVITTHLVKKNILLHCIQFVLRLSLLTLLKYFLQVPENIMREIIRNFNKLAKDLQAQESPEAMAYLRIMGTELGYIKGSELKGIAQYAAMYAEILLKDMPTKVIHMFTYMCISKCEEPSCFISS